MLSSLKIQRIKLFQIHYYEEMPVVTAGISIIKKHQIMRVIIIFLFTITMVNAKLSIPKIFGDNMVIQRDTPIHVWGKASPEKNVRVILGSRDLTVKADKGGNWSMNLEAMQGSNQSKSMSIFSEGETVEFDNVLIGDVWLLGGQSNMEDALESIYHGDTEVLSANFPSIRLMTIPQKATNRVQNDIERINEFNAWENRYELKGHWQHCTPKSVARFSAIGYIFGRRLHMVSGFPVGLIDASVGGTTVEAWTSRNKLKEIDGAKPLIEEWNKKINNYDAEISLNEKIKRWEKDSERRKERGEKPNPKPTKPDLDPANDRNNPGASYNAMIAPISGLNISGTVFNQGYNNALGNARPSLYRKTFQAMIESWRAAFRNPKMPFCVIGLTAGGQPQTQENFELRTVDPGPYIREAQHLATKSLEFAEFLPAYDQQVPWYHPHKKFELGERAARWAMNTVLGHQRIGWKPVELISAEKNGDHFVLTFDRAVRVHDGRPFKGFSISGSDKHFVPSKAEFVIKGYDKNKRPLYDEKRLVISSASVKDPIAVRYAWARNPIGNAVNSSHHERTIPIPSFRTDDWDWPEAPFDSEGNEKINKHREQIRDLRNRAKENNEKRLNKE